MQSADSELSVTAHVTPVRQVSQADKVSVANLYLSLLKRVLTDTVFASGPNTETESAAGYIQSFIKHCIHGNAITMLPEVRLDNLQTCIEDVISNNIPGDVIEAGVWRGGTVIFMKAVLKARNAEHKRVWVADSFRGLPKPDPASHPVEAKAHESVVMRDVYRHFAVSVEEVAANFRRFGLLDDGVEFLEGWFKDTLPTAPITGLSVIRLDADYYESTMDCLTNLYHKLSPGGYIIIDDYGQEEWTYCRQAVDEFRGANHINDPMIRVDSTCYFWQRSS